MTQEESTSVDRNETIAAPTTQFRHAVGWSYATNAVRLASTLGTAFLLAGLLGPEAFGTVALGLIFVNVVQTLIQQGVIPAIVQRQGLTRREMDSVFWFILAISVVVTAACIVLSGPWASANGVPESREVMWALSLLITIKGLVVVQEGLLQRQLRFRELAYRMTIASAAGAVVGIVWALTRPSLWALVAQQLVSAIVGAVALWLVASWRPAPSFRFRDARELLSFAARSTLSSLGVFVSIRADALLVGLYFGAAAIGLYQLGSRLVTAAIETTVQPISGVALPDLSRRQHDTNDAQSRYLSLLGISVAVGVPVLAVVFASATPLMEMIGSEWSAAAIAVRWLCVVGLVSVISMVNSAAVQAAGRPGAQAGFVWFSALLGAVVFVGVGSVLVDADVEEQFLGMASSRALLYALVLLPLAQVLLVRPIIGVGPLAVLRVTAPPVLGGAASAGLGMFVAAGLNRLDLAAGLAFVGVAGTTLVGAIAVDLLVSPHARSVASLIRRRLAGGLASSASPTG